MLLTWKNTEEAEKMKGKHVKLSPTGRARYSPQGDDGRGVILAEDMHATEHDIWIDVLWDNGDLYCYRSGDLEEATVISQVLFWEEEDE